jgi:hypothetical protein
MVQALRQQFDLADDRWLEAKAKADRLGLDIPEYISVLIEEDEDPWGPVPVLANILWSLEVAQGERVDYYSRSKNIHGKKIR